MWPKTGVEIKQNIPFLYSFTFLGLIFLILSHIKWKEWIIDVLNYPWLFCYRQHFRLCFLGVFFLLNDYDTVLRDILQHDKYSLFSLLMHFVWVTCVNSIETLCGRQNVWTCVTSRGLCLNRSKLWWATSKGNNKRHLFMGGNITHIYLQVLYSLACPWFS